MLRRRVKFALNLFGRLFGGYKFYILLLAALGLLSGFLESIGISMLIVFVGYYPLTMFSNLLGVKKDYIPVTVSVWMGNVVIGLAAIALVYYIIKNDK